jgi:FMN-dependent NADH-azoreductase
MKNILLIQSSARGSESYSQRVANSIVNEIKDRHLSTTVTFRDLAEDPLPHVGTAFISALSAKPEELTAEQSDALALSDALIGELVTADVIVLAVPMHNFGIPSTLKAWIDQVVRAGRTFTYSHETRRRMATTRTGNILWICAEKIALGLRAFAINQTRNS